MRAVSVRKLSAARSYGVCVGAGCIGRPTESLSCSIACNTRESGGTGRRTRLRIWRRKAWGFEAPLMRAQFCVVLAAAVVLCGCGSSTEPTGDISLSPTSTDVAGSFNLISANGTAPPFAAFSTSTQDWTLAADTVSIATPNTWTEATKYFVTNRLDNTTVTQY